jgi:hypothetical protein
MAGFDAEAYLRAVGDDQQAVDGPLDETFAGGVDYAAAALVAVGAIAVDRAVAVLAGFGWKARVPVARECPDRCRVVGLNAEVRIQSGMLRLSHARLNEAGTAIVASYIIDHEEARIHHDWIRVPSGWPSGLQPLSVIDDTGTQVSLSFDGWGNDDRWQATLRTTSPVSPATAWLELAGTRVACIDDRPNVQIALEAPAETDAAHAHLWRYLSRCDPVFDSFALDATARVLLASGHLKADDPVLKQFNAVRNELPNRNSPHTAPRGFRNLPEPWRTVIARRGTADGPTGLVLVAAELVELGGHRVAVDVLESFPDCFTLKTRQSPAPQQSVRFRGAVEDNELVWWARDDRGNHYLADWESSLLRFSTSLDPLARELTLMPTTPTSRAIISFPLQWAPRTG